MVFNMLQPQLPRRTGKNYNQWSTQMKCLYAQDLWDMVKNGYNEPDNVAGLNPQQLIELKENRKRTGRLYSSFSKL